MIPCPRCGSDTSVSETRRTRSGARRRRVCDSVTCGGRVTTYEVPSASKQVERAVIVDARELEAIRALTGRLLGIAEDCGEEHY